MTLQQRGSNPVSFTSPLNVWNDFSVALILILIWFHRWILCVLPLTLCRTAHFQIHFSNAKWMKQLNIPAGWISENLTHTHVGCFASPRYNSASVPASLSDRHWGWRGRPSAGIMKGGKHEASLQLYKSHINKQKHKGTQRNVLCGRRTRLVVLQGSWARRRAGSRTLIHYIITLPHSGGMKVRFNCRCHSTTFCSVIARSQPVSSTVTAQRKGRASMHHCVYERERERERGNMNLVNLNLTTTVFSCVSSSTYSDALS